MGVGFGLMVMIGFAGGDPGAAIGVGGFLVIMGAAFLINSLFEHSVDRPVAQPGPFDRSLPQRLRVPSIRLTTTEVDTDTSLGSMTIHPLPADKNQRRPAAGIHSKALIHIRL